MPYMLRVALAISVAAGASWAQAQIPAQQAAGLVLSPGIFIQRNKQPATAVKPGELVFVGDVLRAAAADAQVLSCLDNARVTLPRGAEAVMESKGLQMRTGAQGSRQDVASCFLPVQPKLSLASQQHYGALVSRSGSAVPPVGTLADRISALPEPRRTQLTHSLSSFDRTLSADPRDTAALVGKASLLEQAGLLYDAGESYRMAAANLPGVAWLRRKITQIEDTLLRQSRTR